MIVNLSRWVGGSLLAVAAGFPEANAQDPRLPIPQPVGAEHFEAIQSNSPFFRSLQLTDSIVLTGIGRISGEVFASLVDIETAESYLVSDTVNLQGWQLLNVRGDESSLETIVAEIQVEGGDVVSIRYEEVPASVASRVRGVTGASGAPRLSSGEQKEAKDAAVNYREGFSSDGYPRRPPDEVVRKLARIPVNQREMINQEMIELRNRGLGMEERRRLYEEKVDRALPR
jgi:hypothetical protein